MATMSKSEVADLTLENLGVKPIGQSAASEDSTLAQKVLDTIHDQLQKRRLAPFEMTAVPEYAQIPLRDLASAELAGSYGLAGERLSLIVQNRQRALAELAAQVSTGVRLPQSKTRYF